MVDRLCSTGGEGLCEEVFGRNRLDKGDVGQKGGEAASALDGLVDFGIGVVWVVVVVV